MGTQCGPSAENFFDFFKKFPPTLVMGSENTKTAERILKFLKKHPPTLVMGSEISESAHVLLKKFYFSKIQLISPSTSLMGSHREHFGENFSKFILLLFWWGRKKYDLV